MNRVAIGAYHVDAAAKFDPFFQECAPGDFGCTAIAVAYRVLAFGRTGQSDRVGTISPPPL